MNNRITSLFERKKKDILNIYFTAGYPDLDDTARILKHISTLDVDLVEIGIPFSDPLADGPTIQNSGSKALENGISLAKIFDQLEGIRETVDTPIILMGYLNSLLQFGEEEFCRRCEEVGVDGLIIPDMPLGYYEKHYEALLKKHGLVNIMLVTPETSEERIREIDAKSEAFIYAVSSNSITGGSVNVNGQIEYYNRLNAMNLSTPHLIGFGVSDRDSFNNVCEYSAGGIIGSAFIKAISQEGALEENITKFINEIRN